MEQTISKFPNPFGSVAPHKLFAWGLSATVGYGFAIWGVRIYQNQTVELGGQLLVVLMQAFVLPALLYGVTVLCGIWSMIWGWQAFCRATHAKGLRSIAVYAGCYVLAAILLAIILQTLRHGWHLNW